MSKEVRAAGLIIYRIFNSQIEYLLLQASYRGHHWTPPKGHVDPGEDDLQTALRETEEEAGLKSADFSVDTFSKTLKYAVDGRPKSVIYWLAKLENPCTPIKLSNEHEAFEWAKIERACELAHYPDLQDMLKECEIFLKSKECVCNNA